MWTRASFILSYSALSLGYNLGYSGKLQSYNSAVRLSSGPIANGLVPLSALAELPRAGLTAGGSQARVNSRKAFSFAWVCKMKTDLKALNMLGPSKPIEPGSQVCFPAP